MPLSFNHYRQTNTMLLKSRYISGQQCKKLLWFESIRSSLPKDREAQLDINVFKKDLGYE